MHLGFVAVIVALAVHIADYYHAGRFYLELAMDYLRKKNLAQFDTDEGTLWVNPIHVQHVLVKDGAVHVHFVGSAFRIHGDLSRAIRLLEKGGTR